MYGEIVFYTHGSTVEYGGELFPAGELTSDILNFAPEDYRPIQRILDRMKDLAEQYEDTLDRGIWWEMLTGVYHPDGGTILMDGKEVHFATPADSMAAGTSMVYQERNIIGMYTGAENICLGDEPRKGIFVSPRQSAKLAYEVRERLHLNVPLDVPVEKLGAGEQQLIEILRAFRTNPKVMILDEPTASLSKEEIQPFLDFIKRARDEMDIANIFISHKLEEVFDIADQIAVFTDGNCIINRPVSEVTEQECVAAMLRTDRVAQLKFSQRDVMTGNAPLLSVKDGFYDGKKHDIAFDVYRGEVVGFYGIVGSGRTECLEHLYGLRDAKQRSFVFDGETITKCKPLDMIRRGMIMTAEKRADGLFRGMSILDNVCNLFLDKLISNNILAIIDRKKSADLTLKVLTENEVKYNSMYTPVARLSGGNQQKVAIGRSIALDNIKLLILDEPTTGIDVGAKQGIYERIRLLAEERNLGSSLSPVSWMNSSPFAIGSMSWQVETLSTVSCASPSIN